MIHNVLKVMNYHWQYRSYKIPECCVSVPYMENQCDELSVTEGGYQFSNTVNGIILCDEQSVV